MARSMHPDSAGSQFFIMHEAAPHLDGAYAAFGKVIEGQEHVNKIAETATDYSDRPLETQRMKKGDGRYIWRRLSGSGNFIESRTGAHRRGEVSRPVGIYFTIEPECGTLYEIRKSIRNKRLIADEYGENRQACI